jgi:hypothetical protein
VIASGLPTTQELTLSISGSTIKGTRFSTTTPFISFPSAERVTHFSGLRQEGPAGRGR